MDYTVLIICSTFLIIIVIYWIMPTKKMREVNKEVLKLIQLLPITKIINSFDKKDLTH